MQLEVQERGEEIGCSADVSRPWLVLRPESADEEIALSALMHSVDAACVAVAGSALTGFVVRLHHSGRRGG